MTFNENSRMKTLDTKFLESLQNQPERPNEKNQKEWDKISLKLDYGDTSGKFY